jgi:hypothetical protein
MDSEETRYLKVVDRTVCMDGWMDVDVAGMEMNKSSSLLTNSFAHVLLCLMNFIPSRPHHHISLNT